MLPVSIIVPCFNEQKTIRLLLEAIHAQDYPLEKMEVIIADGLSTDGTRDEVSKFSQEYPDLKVRIIDNPQRVIPAGLNRAIAEAQGDVIIRLDAHSIPRPDYVKRCVTALQNGSGDNVGGVWEIRAGGAGWQARSIAVAAAHPLGVGDARYRYTSRAQFVDTVPFGAFYRSVIERIGAFDESLLTNEDYEFNVRLRKAGGKVWLDPAIQSIYFARSNFYDLARQYWRYGYWKAKMLRRFPETIRWRQALPPSFILSLLMFALLSSFLPQARWLLMIEVLIYSLVLVAVGAYMSLKKHDSMLLLGVPLAIAIMHLTWGSAFLWSMVD